MSTFNEHLLWRYATKTFDPTKTLTNEQLEKLIEATRLSASSYGLQPYRVIVVTDPAVRAKIREHAWNQSQVTDASHLIAICALRSIDEAYVTNYINLVSQTRGIPTDALKGYHDMMMGSITGRTPEQLAQWLRCQAYIASGFLMCAAAAEHIDSCPMEGFDETHVNTDLGLLDKNLTTVMLMPVGFRAEDDASAQYAKVRFPKETFCITQ